MCTVLWFSVYILSGEEQTVQEWLLLSRNLSADLL